MTEPTTPGDTRPCPVCAETIKAAAIKCRFCNADLRALGAGEAPQAERSLFEGHPEVIASAWQWLLVACTLGLAWGWYWLQSRAVRYEITSQRVRVERGLLSKTKESLELFRIDHFDLIKPLGMRLVGHCILHLRSSDTGFASVTIAAIPGLEALADQLREHSLQERSRRRVTTLVQA